MALHLVRTDIALLAAALAVPGVSHAAVRLVTNCSDSGAGSLRAAIATAASGDVVDLSRLTCTRIILCNVAKPDVSRSPLLSDAQPWAHRHLTAPRK